MFYNRGELRQISPSIFVTFNVCECIGCSKIAVFWVRYGLFSSPSLSGARDQLMITPRLMNISR
jgi:hypothetical protein